MKFYLSSGIWKNRLWDYKIKQCYYSPCIQVFLVAYLIYRFSVNRDTNNQTSTQVITFGDENAIRPNRFASVLSLLTLFFLWAAFTGSKLSPIHVPAPSQATQNLHIPLQMRTINKQLQQSSFMFIHLMKQLSHLHQ